MTPNEEGKKVNSAFDYMIVQTRPYPSVIWNLKFHILHIQISL